VDTTEQYVQVPLIDYCKLVAAYDYWVYTTHPLMILKQGEVAIRDDARN